MSNHLDQAIVGIGVTANLVQATNVPEIKVSSTDAPQGAQRADKPRTEFSSDPTQSERSLGSRVARYGGAFVAYVLAGFLGWSLYGLVTPLYASWPSFVAMITPKTEELPDQLRTTRLSAEIHALRSRVEALEMKHGAEAKNLPSDDDISRRIDANKAGADTEIAVLADRIGQLQSDTSAKLADLARRQSAIEKSDIPQRASPAPFEAVHSRRHQRKMRGDAFDPSLNPTAPGVPKPLGFVR